MNELIEVEASNLAELTIRRPPATVIEEAREAAVALKDVLDKKPNKVMMNGEQYLEFEDWQTVAQFYNCKAKVIETKPVQFGQVSGFEAVAVAFHVSSGREVGRAESMCLNDEEKWSSRNKYEWAYVKKSGGHSIEDPGKDELIWVPNPRTPGRSAPKKEKILTGQEHVPLFQLRSMAQTRACSKALRNAFAWVVVLAGYKPTPAEELPDAVRVEQPHSSNYRSADGAGQVLHEGAVSTNTDTSESPGRPPVDAPSAPAHFTHHERKPADNGGDKTERASVVATPATTDAPAQAEEAQASSAEHPAMPYIAKVKTAHDEQEARAAYEATPDPLKQDVYPHYTTKLKELGRRKK